MLALWKESYDQPRQHIKSRDITLLTKVHLVKAMVLPVIMYGYKSWTIKKARCQRIDAFELWCWRRLLRVPWAARRLNQSILKEINPEYLIEGLKLKLQYFDHLMQRADSLEKTLMLGKIEGKRSTGWQRMRSLDGIADSMHMSLSKSRRWWRTWKLGILQSMGSQSQTWLNDWTTIRRQLNTKRKKSRLLNYRKYKYILWKLVLYFAFLCEILQVLHWLFSF